MTSLRGLPGIPAKGEINDSEGKVILKTIIYNKYIRKEILLVHAVHVDSGKERQQK